ncbi:DUF2326 domain-containing protein [Fictibacillus enclensis]|uniref:DUF2326 domain-containing protein n=1 Tax=Fictibacillus enclensis TaxID=1017270 RepID=UPI0024BF4FBF|nr:DUF2326 domain-containing protein [Fictibacillus enclensis]WHY71244.1 DUF2326 domain-containing protein [Fictibacillus enclensis]
MIIQSLYVISFDKGDILKKYSFNETGVNIILGEKRENNDETNGVGKSTMIDCLSFLLGKTIPTYYSNNEILLKKDIFIALQIKYKDRILFLGRSFNNPRYGYTLEHMRPALLIEEWKKISLKEYKEIVEITVLKETCDNISFAALREYIIRDEKTGFNDVLLPNRSSLKQFSLLNYLFSMPYLTELEIKSFKDIIDNMNNEIKMIESMKVNITALRVKEEELTTYIEELDQRIKQAKTTLHYNKSSNRYTDIKKQLNGIQNQIFEYEHICNQYQKNIENLQVKANEIKQLENVEKFYQDLVGFFPNEVKKNYAKVKEFYDFMVESRGNYFKDKISSLKLKLKKLYEEKENIENELEETTRIFKSIDYVEDITIVMDEKRKKELELAEIRVRIRDYNKKNEIAEKINEIQQEIIRINMMRYDEFLSYSNKISELHHLFNELMGVTYKQHGFLVFEYDNRISYASNSTTGRVKISCSIPDERSHGRLHMKINMFDLTWFINRINNDLGINFLVHDGSYSNPDPYVKGTLLKFLNKKLKEIGKGQYIITINKTELLEEDLNSFEKAGMVIAKLDRLNKNQNRFFGFKF